MLGEILYHSAQQGQPICQLVVVTVQQNSFSFFTAMIFKSTDNNFRRGKNQSRKFL